MDVSQISFPAYLWVQTNEVTLMMESLTFAPSCIVTTLAPPVILDA